MRKIMFAVAVFAVVAVVAILARSQLSVDGPSEPAAVAGAPSAEPQQAPAPAEADTVPAQPAPAPAAAAAVEPRAPDPVSAEKPVVPVPNVVAENAAQATTAADVLRRASSAYANVRALRADFAQTRDNPLLGSKTTSRGTLFQKKPDRFLMRFSDPAGDIIVSDGQYFWLYYPSADRRQVLRAPVAENAAGGVDLQAQFLGDPVRRFTHTYHGVEQAGSRSAHVITLIPRENLGYRSLKVWIDVRDSLVRRFVLTEHNGLVQEFQLSNLAINPTLSDDIFRFTPPPDARVVDRP